MNPLLPRLTPETYKTLYKHSVDTPDTFWGDYAQKLLSWHADFSTVKETCFDKGKVSIQWFKDGQLNASYNCIDRHLTTKANKTAIIWEGDNPSDSKNITYSELHEQVCRFANVLKAQGVKKGDRVIIYMPMIPEAIYAMLACSRIGAVHCVVFGGFSATAIADRIKDCEASLVITADEGYRGGKTIPLKKTVDEALTLVGQDLPVLVVKYTGSHVNFQTGRDIWYHQAVLNVNADCPPEPMNAEDPLFILYTSGSTGKPKGVLHTTAGYLLQTAMTWAYAFDVCEEDIFWCTADIGWITGHSYLTYAPLLWGGTTLQFEGVPTYPDAGRFWDVVDKHKVSIFYTAPTAIRSLMAAGDDFVTRSNRSSLRVLGTVGEPINPEAWRWYNDVVGGGRCFIADTFWQTETGAFLMTPLPNVDKNPKAGFAMRPFFGIKPELQDNEGRTVEGAGEGNLVITDSWPSQMRTVYKDHARFEETYFGLYEGAYFTGDGALRDEDGDYRITGRVDDVLNVSGHRIGTAEVESALVLHPAVAEAAVVGCPHAIKGQGIYAFVMLYDGGVFDASLSKELVQWVRKEMGAIVTLDHVQGVKGLPKTRSGKIMRRILRKIAEGEPHAIGDTSTLADPSVVDDIIKGCVL